MLIMKNIYNIFSNLKKMHPNPVIELNYTTSFELLIAVVLSAQTTDISVNKVTKKLFPIANTPEKILHLGENKLIEIIKSIGLYKTKANYIMRISKSIIDNFFSEVPSNRDFLESLPGVGRKTANVVLNNWFKKNTIAVDRHVIRVVNRIGIIKNNNPLIIEKELEKITNDAQKKCISNLLIIHGRYICKAISPKCNICKINIFCNFYKNNYFKDVSLRI